LSTTKNHLASAEPDAPVSLTAREREVLARIAAGMTSKQIAAALGVSLRTINTHREHLAKKLETSSVAGMVRYAIVNGINHPE
jgi:two-component system, NarL family, nitrate/nitrite response regulator NarL